MRNRITRAIAGTVVALAIVIGGGVAANAWTITSVQYIKQCIGRDLWNVKAERIVYSTFEERLGYVNHWRYTPVSIYQWHNPNCSSLSYA